MYLLSREINSFLFLLTAPKYTYRGREHVALQRPPFENVRLPRRDSSADSCRKSAHLRETHSRRMSEEFPAGNPGEFVLRAVRLRPSRRKGKRGISCKRSHGTVAGTQLPECFTRFAESRDCLGKETREYNCTRLRNSDMGQSRCQLEDVILRYGFPGLHAYVAL